LILIAEGEESLVAKRRLFLTLEGWVVGGYGGG
jgi:hypothetical protein